MTIGDLKKIIESLPADIEVTNKFEQLGTTISKVSACVAEVKRWYPCVERSAEQFEIVEVLVIS